MTLRATDDRLREFYANLSALDACLEWLRTRPICPEPELTVGDDLEAQLRVEARENPND